jgi:CubicO group peptidase (beta-lactamase class C family)
VTPRGRATTGVAGLLESAVRAGLAPGFVALAVRAGGGGLSWFVGRRAVGGGPLDADTRFDLASLTKPLATTTLLLLARRDGIGLDARLGDLLPELASSPWREVTVAQCAGHTGGFPAWEPLYAAGGPGREAYLEALARLEPIAPAGERCVYSCPGFVALGLALERAAGADLATLFRELVAVPLGVADELLFAPPAGTPAAGGQREPFVERRLLAERGLAAPVPEAAAETVPCDDGNARGLGGAAGNAGLFGTAAAVAAVAAEYLPGGGELVTAEEAELATAELTGGLEQSRGVGWQRAATAGCSAGPALAPSSFGHTGFTGTSAWVDPVAGAVLVLLSHRLHPGGRTPDLHPLRRRFHALALAALRETAPATTISR